MHVRRFLLAGAAMALVATASMDASAYVRGVTPSCNPVRWQQTCVYVTLDARGTPDLPFADVERMARAAIDDWHGATGPESFLALTYLEPSGPRSLQAEGMQSITFRNDAWPYSHRMAALTTVSYVADPKDPKRDGTIVDADIELNAVDFVFYDAASGPPPADPRGRKPMDLWSTLTHELGHLQGLEHTCRANGEVMPSCARDEQGRAVPACDDVDAERDTDAHYEAIYESAMYPNAASHAVAKREPTADDVSGVVAGHPLSADPKICRMPGGATTDSGSIDAAAPAAHGCNAGGRGTSWGDSILAMIGVALATRRRRRATSRV